ncbi:CHAT domain-containing protein [Thelonectria olida]|uniref:CHAT domain-containing protein n=1 Tax=Thelonectria olida TaxID=1576542 RepID=A0A9P8VZE2_9HYPO|nr:CHAT domain-containing protein [Thelonectria olida]
MAEFDADCVAQEAAEIAVQEWPSRIEHLDSPARSTSRYSVISDELEDLDRARADAFDHLRMGIDDSDKIRHLNSDAAQLSQRYLRTGAIADLDESIGVLRRAVDIMPFFYPHRRDIYLNLGIQLGQRYSRIGAIVDLEEAIEITEQAVDMTATDDPNWAKRLSALANLLHKRYSRTHLLSDLELAIQVSRSTLDDCQVGHPERARILNGLAAQLADKYAKTNVISDLDEAIQACQESIDMTSSDRTERAKYLNTLGNQLNSRYSRTKLAPDLEEAILASREAIDLTPTNHPHRAMYLNSLGNQLYERFVETAAPADLEEAISCFRTALCQLSAPVVDRIFAGRKVLDSCSLRLDWQQAYKDLTVALPLVSQLTSRSLQSVDKQHSLSSVAGLATDAAAVAIYAGRGPLAALKFLERGRGVLTTSLEELRTDIVSLQQEHPALADQFTRLRNELELPVPSNHHPHLFIGTDRRYEAANELNKLIGEIREQPGFDDFLTAPSEKEIHNAALYGPIAVVNVSKYRCDAILVERCRIRLLALPRLKLQEIEHRAGGDLSNPEVLEWLWDTVASPILDALGLDRPPDSHWPHVWWIPTGPLSVFPLHAAGYHDKRTSETVLDRVMSSYSSTIKTIVHGRRRRNTPTSSSQALMIAMDDTPGKGAPLHFASKEVAALEPIFQSMSINYVQSERHKGQVLTHLRSCSVFHFAGHGYTDSDDPLKSYLCLNDWEYDPLTVADLLQLNLYQRSPFLAYLSACGTSQMRVGKYLDESIHLASSCQQAGFRHVIGTLWDVDDEFCVEMARMTYEEMRKGELTDESVCLGLHKACRELRDRSLGSSTRGTRRSNLAGEAESNFEDETSARSESRQRLNELSRKVIVVDERDGPGAFHWVPYVHFGV